MHITHEMVRIEMPAIIAQKGEEFVYAPPGGADGTCMYVWDDAPSCLIARYLVDKGVPVEAFDGFEGMDIDSALDGGILNGTGITVDDQAKLALTHLQWLQDDSTPWGLCYVNTFEDPN
jgi:hypothetical protein